MSDPVTLDTLVVPPADVVMDASPAAPESPLVASTSSLPLDSPSLPLRAPSPPTAPESTAEELEAAATKKRKMAALADENKKRNRRMFGLVTSTLAQAKDQTKKVLGASQKRVDLESRLADKLKKEREEMEEKRLREKSTKDLKFGVVRKEEELATAEAIYRTRHDAKFNLAGFLCTTFTLPAPPPSPDGIVTAYAPRLPHSIRLSNPNALKPIYYLPRRLLPAQEDRIDDQIEAVNKNIKEDKEAWSEVKKRKGDELAEAKEKKAEGHKETERLEKEDREKRRAAGEDVEVKDAEVPVVGVGEDKGTDVEMDGGKDAVVTVAEPVEVVKDTVMEEVAEVAFSIKGAAATTGGDEDELDFE